MPNQYHIPGAPSGYFTPDISNATVQAAGFNRLQNPATPSSGQYQANGLTDVKIGGGSFPYSYPDKSGFGANSYVASSNPSPSANPMGQYTAAARVSATAPVSNYSNSLNVSSGSRSLNPFGNAGIPDLSYANPNTLNRLNISNLIYSAPAGGYIFGNYPGGGNYYQGGSYPANSGGDPVANRRAAAYYNYIGSLPTMQRGSPALMSLYSSGAAQRPPPGPSWNQQVQGFFNNASPFVRNAAQQAGFNTSGYQGPYTFGRRNTGQGGFFGFNLNRY